MLAYTDGDYCLFQYSPCGVMHGNHPVFCPKFKWLIKPKSKDKYTQVYAGKLGCFWALRMEEIEVATTAEYCVELLNALAKV